VLNDFSPLGDIARIAPQLAVKSPSPRDEYDYPQFGLGNQSQWMKESTGDAQDGAQEEGGQSEVADEL
jgi:hypothetical protein